MMLKAFSFSALSFECGLKSDRTPYSWVLIFNIMADSLVPSKRAWFLASQRFQHMRKGSRQQVKPYLDLREPTELHRRKIISTESVGLMITSATVAKKLQTTFAIANIDATEYVLVFLYVQLHSSNRQSIKKFPAFAPVNKSEILCSIAHLRNLYAYYL